MENPNQIQNMGPGMIQELSHGTGTLLCPPPCNGAVCIPRNRYDELLRAENDLCALRRAYQTQSSFSMDYIMNIIFDPALKYQPEPTPETEAVPTGGAGDAE